MILKRKRLGKVQITFVLDGDQPEPVFVAGEFSDWQPALPLKRSKDGTWRATLSAHPGEAVLFRYVTESGRWFDDDQADEIVPNALGGTNSLAVA